MSFFALAGIDDPVAARRAFLGKSGLLLSGAAVAMLAGKDALAAASSTSDASDVRILNTALAAELEAIAAYQVGAESGLLQKPVLDLAVVFQGHHREHAAVLAKTVEKLGGKVYDPIFVPLDAKDLVPYLAKIPGDTQVLFSVFFGEGAVLHQIGQGRAGRHAEDASTGLVHRIPDALLFRQPGGKLTDYDAHALRTFAHFYFTVPALIAALVRERLEPCFELGLFDLLEAVLPQIRLVFYL